MAWMVYCTAEFQTFRHGVFVLLSTQGHGVCRTGRDGNRYNRDESVGEVFAVAISGIQKRRCRGFGCGSRFERCSKGACLEGGASGDGVCWSDLRVRERGVCEGGCCLGQRASCLRRSVRGSRAGPDLRRLKHISAPMAALARTPAPARPARVCASNAVSFIALMLVFRLITSGAPRPPLRGARTTHHCSSSSCSDPVCHHPLAFPWMDAWCRLVSTPCV